MSSPIPWMTQSQASTGKSDQEYANAWGTLNEINRREYGSRHGTDWRTQARPPSPPTGSAGAAKAPDMSAYAQPAGGFNAYNAPRTPPAGARQNDLSGQVPSNQIWAQAFNHGSQQYGGNTQAQSWTMPGMSTSQGYNPATGQYSPMTGGQSWDGNLAHNAINQRPGPIQASATGVNGSPMQWQDAMRQREAFVGNLSQRLGQYSGGQATGPVTFDPNQLLSQADDQLANGTFYNPFSPQNQGGYFPSTSMEADFQRAMGNSTQYMQGNFQNPFGPQANVPQPSWDQRSYDPVSAVPQRNAAGAPAGATAYTARPQGGFVPGVNYSTPWNNDPTSPLPAGYKWQKVNEGSRSEGWLPVSESEAAAQPSVRPRVSGQPGQRTAFVGGDIGLSEAHIGTEEFERILAAQQDARMRQLTATPGPFDRMTQEDLGQEQARYGSTSSVGEAFVPERQAPPPVRTAPGMAMPKPEPSQGTPYNPQERPESAPRVSGRPDAPQARDAKLARIDDEIRKWKAATYGTRQGSGPPAAWQSHIQALQRLRGKAAAGDPAALAWRPKMQAPSQASRRTVPTNRR